MKKTIVTLLPLFILTLFTLTIFPSTTEAACTGTETTGPCRAVRVNEAAANTLAAQAQTALAAAGYNALCIVNQVSLGGGIDPTTGLGYYYDTTCTVNGNAGYSAELILSPGGMNVLKTELGSSGNNNTGGITTGGSVTSTSYAIPNLSGVSTSAIQKYFPSGFNPTSSRDQAVAAQLKIIQLGKNFINKYFNDFAQIMGGCPVGANSFGVTNNITGGKASANCQTTSSSPGSESGISSDGATEKVFRYLKIDIRRAGWVALRELELYDGSGAKMTISPSQISASCTWCNYGTAPSGVTVSSLVDGNISTLWNAGETAPGCDWSKGGCPSSTVRSGWVTVDLGAPTTVSRIRFSGTGSENETTTLLVSNGGSSFSKIAEFVATPSDPFGDKQWLEYPAPTNSFSGNPTALLTINGSSSASISSGGDGVMLVWNSTNADKGTFTASGFNPQCIPYGKADPYGWGVFPYKEYDSTGLQGMGTQFGGSYFWRDLFTCEGGRTIKLTYTTGQRATGLSAQSTVSISVGTTLSSSPRVVPSPNNPDRMWGYEINTTYVHFVLTPGSSSSSLIQVNVDSGSYGFPDGHWETRAYPFPVITVEAPSGITASLGSPQILPEPNGDLPHRKTMSLSVNVSGSIQPGLYTIRIYGNKGAADEGRVDIPVFVTSDTKPQVNISTEYPIGPTKTYTISPAPGTSSGTGLTPAQVEQKKQEIKSQIDILNAQIAEILKQIQQYQQP